MTDPAIQDGREAIRDVLLRLFVPTRGEIVSFNKTMALIDAWGAEREAAGAVAAIDLNAPMNIRCGGCDQYRDVRMRWEEERGDMGSLLSTWPEFDLVEPCAGPPLDYLGIEEGEIEAEQRAEACPFHKYHGDTQSPTVEAAVDVYRDRRRRLKAAEAHYQTCQDTLRELIQLASL